MVTQVSRASEMTLIRPVFRLIEQIIIVSARPEAVSFSRVSVPMSRMFFTFSSSPSYTLRSPSLTGML